MQGNRIFLAFISLAFITSCGGGGGGTSTSSAANTASSHASTASTASSHANSSNAPLGMSHNAGQDCMSCHKTGAAAASIIFTLAGTVYKTGGAAQTSATVQLYIHGSNTLSISLNTDSLGNFYTTQPVQGLFVPGGGLVSGVDVLIDGPVASDTGMSGLVTNGSCNACHGVSRGHITAN